MSPLQRFWAKVDVTDTCWLWTGARTGGGYGNFWTGERYAAAHRWLYELLIGPVPEGHQLDHLCRVRECVRPHHLEPVTAQENLLRGETIPAAHAAKTHCPQGHPYDEENTIMRARGTRECRTCENAAQRRRYQKVKK